MSSSPSSTLSFKQTIALTAVVASLATSAAILSYQAVRREHATERLKRQVGEDVDEWERSRSKSASAESPFSVSGGADDNVSPWSVSEKKQREFGKGQFDESLIREQVRKSTGDIG